MYVKRTSNEELYEHWRWNPKYIGEIFIACNELGDIEWQEADVYQLEELLKRGKVKLI
jgi:hypothetical protein